MITMYVYRLGRGWAYRLEEGGDVIMSGPLNDIPESATPAEVRAYVNDNYTVQDRVVVES